MTEMEARREAMEARARGVLALATHTGRTRQDALPSPEWVVIYGPVTFE